MIQIAALSRIPILAPAAPATGGDAAAFGLSLDAMLDMPGQPVAVPGKPLPPTPVAPVSAAPSVLDTGVTPAAPPPAIVAPSVKNAPEAPKSAADESAAVATTKPVASAIVSSPPPYFIPKPSRAAGTAPPTPVVRAPDGQCPNAVPRPGDDLQPSQPIEARQAPTFDSKPTLLPTLNASIPTEPDEEATEAVAVPRTQFAARPSRLPPVARTTTAVALAPDSRGEPRGVFSDDAPETSANPAPAAVPTPFLASPSPDAASAMPVAVTSAPPPTPIDAPVLASPAPDKPPAVVEPKRATASPPVAHDPPAPPPRSVAAVLDRAPLAPLPGEAPLASSNIAPSPAAVLSPEPQQPNGEPPHPAADRQALSQPLTTIVAPADNPVASRGADPTAVAPAAGQSSDDAGAGDAPSAQASARPRVEPAPAPQASPTPIAEDSPPTSNIALSLPSSANVVAAVGPALAPPKVRRAPAAMPVSSPGPGWRDDAVAPAMGRVDPAPSPAAASAPVQPVSAAPAPMPAAPSAAPPIASPPAATAQVGPAPIIPATLAGPQATKERSKEIYRSDTAPAPVTLVAPPRAQLPVIAAGTTAPAFRLFAEAIHAARRDERIGDPLAPAPSAIVDPARAALPVGGSAALDMTDHRWPHAMIDRIEALRDFASAAADAADTNIRLVPASLGTIDVSLRRDGDTVHVHFAAEQAATRALLTEAQPRLAELAESRGLKLGQASVGAGADQNAQRQPAQHPTRIPAAPASAARDDEPDTATTRVA